MFYYSVSVLPSSKNPAQISQLCRGKSTSETEPKTVAVAGIRHVHPRELPYPPRSFISEIRVQEPVSVSSPP